MATRNAALGSPQAIFTCVSASETSAKLCASLPVPAVVGTRLSVCGETRARAPAVPTARWRLRRRSAWPWAGTQSPLFVRQGNQLVAIHNEQRSIRGYRSRVHGAAHIHRRNHLLVLAR